MHNLITPIKTVRTLIYADIQSFCLNPAKKLVLFIKWLQKAGDWFLQVFHLVFKCLPVLEEIINDNVDGRNFTRIINPLSNPEKLIPHSVICSETS